MEDSLQLVRWYCLVGFLRINANFVTGALESLLWQRETQYSTAVVGLCKLALVAAVVWQGGMDLRDLVAIEVITELMLLVRCSASPCGGGDETRKEASVIPTC